MRSRDDHDPAGLRHALGGGRSYGWLIGVLGIVAVIAFVLGNGDFGPTAQSVRGLQAGERLPPFAVPLATSALDCDEREDPCDANVATAPGQEGAGSRPACAVRGATVLNVCEIGERGPLVLAFLAARDGRCAGSLDVLDEVAERHPGVGVAVVSIRGELGDLRALVRARGWRFAVGWDRDGILARLYGVATCPYITYARWRGQADSTSLGEVSRSELDRRIEAAVAASVRSGWRRARAP